MGASAVHLRQKHYRNFVVAVSLSDTSRGMLGWNTKCCMSSTSCKEELGAGLKKKSPKRKKRRLVTNKMFIHARDVYRRLKFQLEDGNWYQDMSVVIGSEALIKSIKRAYSERVIISINDAYITAFFVDQRCV